MLCKIQTKEMIFFLVPLKRKDKFNSEIKMFVKNILLTMYENEAQIRAYKLMLRRNSATHSVPKRAHIRTNLQKLFFCFVALLHHWIHNWFVCILLFSGKSSVEKIFVLLTRDSFVGSLLVRGTVGTERETKRWLQSQLATGCELSVEKSSLSRIWCNTWWQLSLLLLLCVRNSQCVDQFWRI